MTSLEFTGSNQSTQITLWWWMFLLPNIGCENNFQLYFVKKYLDAVWACNGTLTTSTSVEGNVSLYNTESASYPGVS
jgi:hypothetical protein